MSRITSQARGAVGLLPVAGTLEATGSADTGVTLTERKPAEMSMESWVERQIRDAQERGEFDDLPGEGKPLPGLTGHYDEMWWIKQLVRREKLSVLPPLLALRKEAEHLLDGLTLLPSEAAVRDLVADYNARVVEAIRRPQEGPFLLIPRRLDVDDVVARWARERPGTANTSPTSSLPVLSDAVESEKPRPTRWWRFRSQRARGRSA